MTEVGTVYGGALYELAASENMSGAVSEELTVLRESFDNEPGFIRLLGAPNLSKQERCQILDDCFRGRVAPYTLNFLKILTEKGYIRHFSHCCDAYMSRYYEDNGILPVTAVTAVSMTEVQTEKLRQKLRAITGKNILLHSRVEPGTLGGVRLEYDGRQLDDTVANRLQSIRDLLKKTVL